MDGAKDFEELRVFQEARKLTKRIYSLTRSGSIAKDFGLMDQMRRAAVSVVSNIAEGFETQTDPDFIRFLYIAKRSCGELRAQAVVAFDLEYWPKEIHEEVRTTCCGLSAGLANLIRHLEGKQKPRLRNAK